MGLLDLLTGGKSGDASEALEKARQVFAGLKTPTKEELTLPELQQYVVAGLISPAQAEAYLQERNAYEGLDIDQAGTEAQREALNQLARVSEAGPEGTPEQQAAMAATEANFNRSVGGQRGAIEQAMQARGIPTSLIQAALEGQAVGQDAVTANQADLAANEQAYRAALDAMSARAGAGATLQGQQNQQANTVANAANAMQQFNAANQTAVSQGNAARTQEASTHNADTKQNAANLNTSTANERTKYNTEAAQRVYDNQLKKAMGEAGAYSNIADLAQQQGEQQSGFIGGLIGTAGNVAGAKMNQPPKAAHGMIADLPNCDEGGVIPGQPEVMGDSEDNDKIHAMVSPGEAVIPRTAVMRHMPEVLSMLSESRQEPEVSPEDLAQVILALKSIRMGARQ